MDDEDSKVRRNLIVVSVLMILVWWLQAPLDKVSEKFFGVSPNGPAFEWRVWLAAALALAYFCLRFRFCQDHTNAVTVMRNERRDLERRLLRRWIEAALWAFRSRGWHSSHSGSGVRENSRASREPICLSAKNCPGPN